MSVYVPVSSVVESSTFATKKNLPSTAVYRRVPIRLYFSCCLIDKYSVFVKVYKGKM